ncbi:sodium/sugar symporter [Chitinophaga barathri]|uniref:Sodium transporter n=1 Tax=Chitinophaga barathri TaxID=1647451 RepID=A0A3N4MH01_9BACT|nr:sodium/sugar symporter [Chitinophaga barathri]RPD41007.1 sodium transporter [Chitinophaga barathri]
MEHKLLNLDYFVFAIYFVIVAGYGYYIYNRKKKALADTKDFFLAEGSLTWWAIGASLIASNISAEQFIGMSGSGFKMGLAISTYEWMAAATLLVVAIFFLPIYLKNKIYTMPQFLLQRYDSRVSTVMAVFWLLLYVFVNLTSILYLGALAVSTISGFSFTACMIGLAVFAVIITLGGMKVIGFTDVIQVFFLILGGLATTYLALNLVSQNVGNGGDSYSINGMMDGLGLLRQKAPEHFHMIFDKSNPNYMELPGLAVLIGGMWIVNLNYWGCNQYITQRALGADLKTARKGLLFAGFLKLLMPIIVVLPGIATYVLWKNGMFQEEMQGMVDGVKVVKPDHAYPILLNLLPAGLKGLSFAALTAAIVASLAGKANSIATIFTLDIYKHFFKKEASEQDQVKVGRIAIIVACIIAAIVAPALKSLDQGFQFIQEYTGFISPGVFAIFILGFFWKRTTANAALVGAALAIPLSVWLKFQFTALPFINRMGWVFLIIVAVMAVISLLDPRSKDNPKALRIDGSMFRLDTAFTIGAILICGILAALYTVFW